MKVKHLLVVIIVSIIGSCLALYWYFQNQDELMWSQSMLVENKGKVFTQGPPKDPFLRPVGVNLDKAGNIYVADSDNHRIRVFNENWELLNQFGKVGKDKGQFGYPVAVATNSFGELYVSEVYNNRVQVLSRDGKFLRWLPKNKQDLVSPSSLFISASDKIFIFDRADQKVKVFNNEGTILKTFGGTNEPGERLRFVMGMGLTPGGDLVVSDSGNRMIKIFGQDGRLKEQLLSSIKGIPAMGLPRGLAVINENKFAVVDSLARKVYLLEREGQGWKHKALDHQFILPDGLSYRNNKLYVTDRGENAIVVFDDIR